MWCAAAIGGPIVEAIAGRGVPLYRRLDALFGVALAACAYFAFGVVVGCSPNRRQDRGNVRSSASGTPAPR
jgi:hypothetical protein